MPSLETVEVPLLPGEEVEISMAGNDAAVATATAPPDADIDDASVDVAANHPTNKTATASSALKRKITPSSNDNNNNANNNNNNANNDNNNKRKKSNQMSMKNFFGKPSTTMTPQMTASAKKKTSASKNAPSVTTTATKSMTKTAKSAAVGTDKTAASTTAAAEGDSKRKSKPQQKEEPSPEQLTAATATATATTTKTTAETTTATTTISESAKRAELRSIVMGKSWNAKVVAASGGTNTNTDTKTKTKTATRENELSSTRKLNVKLLEKFDQDDPPTAAQAAADAETAEDPAGQESSSETTIATTTPTITTVGSTTSICDLDHTDADADAEKNEVELELDIDTNDQSDDGEFSKKEATSAAAPASSKDQSDGDVSSKKETASAAAAIASGKDLEIGSSELKLELELECKKSAGNSADEPSTTPDTISQEDAPADESRNADPSMDEAVLTTNDDDDDDDNNNDNVEQQSSMDLEEPSGITHENESTNETTEEAAKDTTTPKTKSFSKARTRSGSKGSTKDGETTEGDAKDTTTPKTKSVSKARTRSGSKGSTRDGGTTEEASKDTTTPKTNSVSKARSRSASKGSAKDGASPNIMSFFQSKATSSSTKKKTEPKENKTTEASTSTAKTTEAVQSKSKTSSAAVLNGNKKTKSNKSVVSSDAEKSTADLTSEPAPRETTLTTLSDESKALLEKHETMRAKYRARANELLGLLSQGLGEENFSIPVAENAEIPLDASMEGGDFPDFAVNTLAALVEGSRLPLSALAQVVLETLNTLHDTDSFRLESTTAKIKLLATRVKYVKNPSLITEESSTSFQGTLSTDLFEDENEHYMWRWEVATIDFLPEVSVSQVKKARSARRKASSRVNALARLLAALNDADKLLLDSKASKEKLGKAAAKISQEEEKALKFEREDEKARLENEIKKKKEEEKLAEHKKKGLEVKEKEQAAEEKRKEKEQKKAEVGKAREESKRKKAAELEEKQKKENRLKEGLNSQKACMKSFFGARKPAKKQEPKVEKVEAQLETKKEVETLRQPLEGGFDVEAFRSGIDSGKALSTFCPFASLSAQAKRSRKRNTKKVAVSVFVTVMPDNAFESQPYAERQDVMVQNKYKFLRFHENCRPPYHGTWSKRSSIIKGKKPFGKDTTNLDYDYDSEAEWEEGDEEAGEDLENDMGDEDEEKDEEEGSLGEDGWLAADDEVEDDLDEETKMLRKKQLECGDHLTQNNRAELTACLVAPMDGLPLTELRCKIGSSRKNLVEGLDFKKGFQLLEAHQATTLIDFEIWLDAFPPALIEEDAATPPDQSASDGTKSSGQDMSSEDMKIFARFVHLCTLGSKDKVVDELRSAHESVTSSRAQAIRVLDSIADKRKHPNNSVYWEVKKEVLEKLGLEDLVAKTADVGLDADGATQENKRKVAMFVHHCTISSKEKVVDELRSTLESATVSRADAMRVLESVAEKKKDSVNGVYWEVKKEVRDELGLQDLPTSPPPSTKETTKPTNPPQLNLVQTTTQKEKGKAEEKLNSSGKKKRALSQENIEEQQQKSSKKKVSTSPGFMSS